MINEIIGWIFSIAVIAEIVIAITIAIIFIKKRNKKLKKQSLSRKIDDGDKTEVIGTNNKGEFISTISYEKGKAKLMRKAVDKKNKELFNSVADEWKQKSDIIKKELTENSISKFNCVDEWSTLNAFMKSISSKCPKCGSKLERSHQGKLSYGGTMQDVTYTRRESTGLYIGFNPVYQDVTYTQKALVGAVRDKYRTMYVRCAKCDTNIFTQESTRDDVKIILHDLVTESGDDTVKWVERPAVILNKFNLIWHTPTLDKELSQELKNYIDNPAILPD